MSEFTKRAITGAVYVALTLGAAVIGPWTTFLLFLPVCVIGAREWHRLYHIPGESDPGEGRTMVLAAIAFIAVGPGVLLPKVTSPQADVLILIVIVFLVFDLMKRGVKEPGKAFAGYLATLFYIVLPFTLTVVMVDDSWHVFVGFMILLWTSDTGAYLVGRSIGRTKLMPSVSPGKTWEGLLGGVALTLLMGWTLSRYWLELSPVQWMAASVAVAVTATLGDLLESAFKRARGVKDSGTILPGHGGILDRFDGFLLAAPAMNLLIRLFD